MLKHAKGNLLDLALAGEFDAIVHGCNCFNAMGGGIAREIAERFPDAKAADDKTVRADYNKLGNYTFADINGVFRIFNAYTQFNTSRGEDVFEYEAFVLILKKLAYNYPALNWGLPYIGMGLAGGESEVIIEMIEDFAKTVTAQGGSVTLVEFEP